MIGAEEQNGPTCFTTLPAYARRLGRLNESPLPIVPTGATLSARGLKFQVPHSFFDAVAAILFEAPAAAVFSLGRWRAPDDSQRDAVGLVRHSAHPSPSAGTGEIIDAALIAACTAAVETLHAPRTRALWPSLSTPLLSSKSRRIVRADPPRERRLMGGFDFRLRAGDADCNGASKLAAPRLFCLRPDKLLRSLIRAAPFG
jgi:hypothetical protein